MISPNSQAEKVILTALKTTFTDSSEFEASLEELEQLISTAGGMVVTTFVQEREKPHVRTFIGPGKAEEIAKAVEDLGANLVVVNGDLASSQQNNLGEIIGCKIIDRTALILDIFAQHAHSSEGKLQVELAQYTYLLPRLTGRGIELSRLGGGIGTRGPGETKLEVDRRRIRRRIQHLKRELQLVRKSHQVQRKRRKEASVYNLCLVGYTNAGKSSLLNTLTKANVLVEDQLFATLDSTTRRLNLSSNQNIVLSDTVGFIRGLPPQLIAAFRSTLDEVGEADLLLNVIDGSAVQVEEQTEAVEKVLRELEAEGKPRIDVVNKIDLLSQPGFLRLRKIYPKAIFISCKTRQGISILCKEIAKRVASFLVRVSLRVPFSKGQIIQRIHKKGRVISEKYLDTGTEIVAEIPESYLPYVKKFLKD